MALNIKNERVCELAREAGRRTGQTQTSAIERALEVYLDSLDIEDATRERRRDAALREQRRMIDEIVAEFHHAPASERDVAQVMDELYDPITGLPR